jgi:signal transduction histidine kinase
MRALDEIMIKIATRLYKFFSKIYVFMQRGTEAATYQIVPFAVFAAITFPIFYILNLKAGPNVYESLFLRGLIVSLCIPLMFKNFWPQKLKSFLPILWYLTLLYTFMLLKNNVAIVWQMNIILSVLLLILVADWLSFIVLTFLGFFLALFVYWSLSGNFYFPNVYEGGLHAFVIALIFSAFFPVRKAKAEHEKLQTIQSIGASIAHELRTPLSSIGSGIKGAKKYLPLFIEGYNIAKQHGLKVPFIRPSKYEVLSTVLTELEEEVSYSNLVINMLLVKSRQKSIEQSKFQICSIQDCIRDALHRYPFQSHEEELIEWNKQNDFLFKGEAMLMVHVLFNLIKNSLYFIAAEGKGQIEIRCEVQNGKHLLHFKDTAKGIAPRAVAHLFEAFHTNTVHGTGLGLAFCKMVINSFGGSIRCESQYGVFTDFIITFPIIKEN